MQLYQQNWATFGSSGSPSRVFLLYAWRHNYGGKYTMKEEQTHEPGRSRLLVGNHGNNVSLCHFENRADPEGWGSEVGYELTQQHEAAKAWQCPRRCHHISRQLLAPGREHRAKGPTVSVSFCSLQPGVTLCPDTACPLTMATLGPERLRSRKRWPALLLRKLRTAQRHQLETPESALQQGTREQQIPK